MTPSLGFYGAGRVATGLATVLAARGWRVTAVASRNPDHARALAEAVGADALSTAGAVFERAELTLLTVPDDAIRPVAEQAAAETGDWVGHAVVHTSGARGAAELAGLTRRGMAVGSLHPAYPFAGGTRPDLTGVSVAVEAADPTLNGWLLELVRAVGGRPLAVPEGGKAQYHAALVIAANFAVTLYADGERLLTDLGIDRDAADSALNSLLAGTHANLARVGVPAALTGPASRADTGTMRLHIEALAPHEPELAEMYRLLTRRTLRLAGASESMVNEVDRQLKGERAHAPDRP